MGWQLLAALLEYLWMCTACEIALYNDWLYRTYAGGIMFPSLLPWEVRLRSGATVPITAEYTATGHEWDADT